MMPAIPPVTNSTVNQSDSLSSPSSIMQAIHAAATKTGVDFSYLLKKASQESGLDSSAKASSSSASGLYQFTGQTWLGMIKNYGGKYGLDSYASQITISSSGHLQVSDPTLSKQILALRNDPQIASEMAGELDKENASTLRTTVGGKIGNTDLYLAHFLGAGGATSFLHALKSDPTASAAAVVPTAAASNPAVFYGKDGQPRSLQQIYQHFAQKFDQQTQFAVAASSPHTAAQVKAASLATQHAFSVAMSPSKSTTPLYSSLSDATPVSSGLRGTMGAGTVNLSGSSTAFAAMVLGQMDSVAGGQGFHFTAHAEDKKHNALTSLVRAA